MACLKHLASSRQGAIILAVQEAGSAHSPALNNASVSEAPEALQQQRQQPHSNTTTTSMLQQVLLDVQQMAKDASAAVHDPAGVAVGTGLSGSAVEGSGAAQLQVAAMLDDAASFIQGLVGNLEPTQLLQLPLASTLQVTS